MNGFEAVTSKMSTAMIATKRVKVNARERGFEAIAHDSRRKKTQADADSSMTGHLKSLYLRFVYSTI